MSKAEKWEINQKIAACWRRYRNTTNMKRRRIIGLQIKKLTALKERMTREQAIAEMRECIPKCECPAAKRPTEFDCAFPACVGEAVQISTELLVQALALMEAQENEIELLHDRITEIRATVRPIIANAPRILEYATPPSEEA